MTVRELITLLQSHNPDLRVVVDGYENSFCDVTPDQVYPLRIVLGVGQAYGGDHDTDEDKSYGQEHERAAALLISRSKKG